MGEDKDAVAVPHAFFRDFRKDNRLPASCRENEQGLLKTLLPLPKHRLHRFLLIGAERHSAHIRTPPL